MATGDTQTGGQISPVGSPSVAGTHGNQKSYTGQTLQPFSGVTITDGGSSDQIFVGVDDDLSVGTLSSGSAYPALAHQSQGGTLVQYSFEGTPEQVTAELDGLVYTPTSSLRRNNLMLVVTDIATKRTAFDGVTTIDNATDTDRVAVDPTVTYDPNGAFELTGTATSSRIVGSLRLTGTTDGETGFLGSGPPGIGDTFRIYDPIGPAVQFDLVVTETDTEGQQASTPVDFTLQGGIQGQRYVAVQTTLDPVSKAATGQTFFRADGQVVYHDAVAENGDGTTSYTYSDGTYFDHRPYSTFTDTYGGDGTLLTEQRLRDDGRDVVVAEAPGQSLTSSYDDVFRGNMQGATRFMFSSGYGQDGVLGFRLTGPDHDVLSLPSADFASIADVLRSTQDAPAGAVITDPASGDAVKVAGITKAQLAHHSGVLDLHG